MMMEDISGIICPLYFQSNILIYNISQSRVRPPNLLNQLHTLRIPRIAHPISTTSMSVLWTSHPPSSTLSISNLIVPHSRRPQTHPMSNYLSLSTPSPKLKEKISTSIAAALGTNLESFSTQCSLDPAGSSLRIYHVEGS